ncbi:UTP--glucose-1-phosphate uridylyltransferase [Candidatus Hepatincolaceae symbiont of Richtersius coronifer]
MKVNKQKIKKAVFPVAGLGTRFLPATKVLPKEMLPIFNKSVIHYAVEEAIEAGIEEFIFVTGRGKGIIEDHFDISYELEQHLINNNKEDFKEMITQGIPKPGKSFFTRQQRPLGLGHAVWCAQALLNCEPFAVLLPDEFLKSSPSCLKEMINLYNNSDAEIILAGKEIPLVNVSSYGIFNIGDNKINNNIVKLKSLVEKPKAEEAPSQIAIIGRYILQPSIFSHLSKEEKGSGGEIQLTDAIDNVLSSHNSYGYIYEGERYDCGNPIGLLEASIEVALNDPKHNQRLKQFLSNKIN